MAALWNAFRYGHRLLLAGWSRSPMSLVLTGSSRPTRAGGEWPVLGVLPEDFW